MPRDTRTGGVLESMVRPALDRGAYTYMGPTHIGARVGGGKHLVDLVVTSKRGERFLVSMKWQQTSGTAEQKVRFRADELMNRAEAANHSRYLVDETTAIVRFIFPCGIPTDRGAPLREDYFEELFDDIDNDNDAHTGS